MSPRQAPTKTFRFASRVRPGSQSRSQLAGLRGIARPGVLPDDAVDERRLELVGGRPDAVDVPGRRLEVDELRQGRRRRGARARARRRRRARPDATRIRSPSMTRPVTLFTGQWADLPLEDLAEKAGRWGFDGLELACWGDHFEVDRALAEDDYCAGIQEVLERNHLNCFALGAHLVGQAVCDPIDARHQAILPPDVWGDGDPAGVQQRAAERMKDTARAAARARRHAGERLHRLGGLAHALLVPAERLRRDRARLRGLRRALVADHRRLRRRGREVRARGAPDRDRLRLRHHAARRWTRSTTARASGSTSTRATSRTSTSTPRSSRSSSPTGSTTSTSRTRASGSTGGGRSSART